MSRQKTIEINGLLSIIFTIGLTISILLMNFRLSKNRPRLNDFFS